MVIDLPAVAVASVQHWTATALQQGAGQTPVTPEDSVVVQSPLPGGAAAVTRFLLNNVPQPVQIAGVFVAAIVAVLVVWYLVRLRVAIRTWLATRSRGVAIALGAGALLLAAAFVGMGTATWNYTQHSNEFCTGCHIMHPAFERFGTATNKHAELSCHDCHQQSLYASARQVYLWVAERPEKIGPHAKVPNRVCESCHVTGDTARWQHIASTAGHRVHLESDSSALRDVQCVTCHATEVHRFKPVNATCGQSGCHDQSETNIALGKMATQTSIHCTSCHAFTAEVPALATRDSTRGTLVPGQPQCLGCHEMRRVLSDFDPAKDPHGGKCGTCHNPHTQETPRAAAQTCTTAACHGNWRDEPFHTGAAHRAVATRCLTCHVPHQAKVDASDCTGCHASVRSRGRGQPPLPFDTTRALRRVSALPHAVIPSAAPALRSASDEGRDRRVPDRGTGPRWLLLAGAGCCGVDSLARPQVPPADCPLPTADCGSPPTAVSSGPTIRKAVIPRLRLGMTGPSLGATTVSHPSTPSLPALVRPATFVAATTPAFARPVAWPPPTAADTFSHTRHAKLACLVCHRPGDSQNRLTFERPRGCQICHHEAPTTARCAACHQPQELAAPTPVTVTVAVAGHQPRARPVDFLHTRHTAQTCTQCHTTPVTLAPAPGVAQCTSCHTAHHAANRACATCHAPTDPKTRHTLESAHQRCDACHAQTTVARLTPTRTFCATCHVPKATNHYDQKECTTCHFLAEPDAYRSKLTTSPR